MNAAGESLLELSRVAKCYGSVTVLDGCSLSVESGEIHALLGANGAGKSTLVRIVAGLVGPTSGAMKLNGAHYEPTTKKEAERRGVEIVQQELNLIPTLSVAENLLLNRLPSRAGVIRQRELRQRARAALDRFGLRNVDTDVPVASLGVGHQQMLEIAAALDRDCQLLILDEPTAALSAAETETLFQRLEQLRQQGVGIIYITHRLDEVARLATRVSVLRDGQVVGTFDGQAGRPKSTEELIGLMSGEEAEPSRVAAHESERNRAGCDAALAPVLLRVEGLSGGMVQDVTLELHRGERLGIAGLVGSGRTELLRLIFGADVADRGGVRRAGDTEPRRFRRPADAVAAGIAMVTEDRKQNGLLLTQSIRVNTSLAALWRRFSRWGVIRQRDETLSAGEMCEALETRCSSVEQRVGTLSGGNQQKVAIAKWLVRDAEVFLFDEPTRGIDVAARRRIYRLFDSLASDGKGLVIVSSDVDELLETCDRIAVMSNGRLVDTITRLAATPEPAGVPLVSERWRHDFVTQAAFSGYLDRRGRRGAG